MKYIANGSQLISKKMDRYYKKYPFYYQEAKGIKIKSDDKWYLDYSTMAQGSCMLGYSNEIVNDEVKKAIDLGNMASLNSHYEIKLAKKLREHEPNKLYRYFKTGGEALAAAVRIARSQTGESIVLFNGYHGWNDWYLASNYISNNNHLGITSKEGVPKELYGTSIQFNNKEELINLIAKYNGKLACVVIELARYKIIDQDILEVLKKSGLIIIADEVTTGWRVQLGGIWKRLNINPDIIVYGKAISNGHSFSMIAMKKYLEKAVEKSFISSLYWSDSTGMAAAYATIKELEYKDYNIKNKLENVIRNNIENRFGKTDGIGMIHYNVDEKWVKYCLKKGVLVTNQMFISFAHNDYNIIDELLNNYKE